MCEKRGLQVQWFRLVSARSPSCSLLPRGTSMFPKWKPVNAANGAEHAIFIGVEHRYGGCRQIVAKVTRNLRGTCWPGQYPICMAWNASFTPDANVKFSGEAVSEIKRYLLSLALSGTTRSAYTYTE
ncbi:unnamed protein product [Toxocara canis]|uniref:Sushi domain-containing protein n=1 Tax=Toxocara canis TaxID=6265 RepID=A0A183UY75_TOXCA|nr:unnamed protein product [Toxocara canis]